MRRELFGSFIRWKATSACAALPGLIQREGRSAWLNSMSGFPLTQRVIWLRLRMALFYLQAINRKDDWCPSTMPVADFANTLSPRQSIHQIPHTKLGLTETMKSNPLKGRTATRLAAALL